MEWLVFLIILIINTVIQAILEYQKLKKSHLINCTKTTTTTYSDLDLLEQLGISPRLRKAVEVMINETKSLNAVSYAKKIASVCFGSPSPAIKSNDPFGSIEDIPETPFYTYLPVPFTPTSNAFLSVSASTTETAGTLLDTGLNLDPYGNTEGMATNQLGDRTTGRVYILCKLVGQSVTTFQTSDMVKMLSSFIQFFWNGLLQNADKGAWVAFSNMVIEEPFCKNQEALNYLMTLISYYCSTNHFYRIDQNGNRTNADNSFISKITGWFIYDGYFCITVKL